MDLFCNNKTVIKELTWQRTSSIKNSETQTIKWVANSLITILTYTAVLNLN